MPKLNMSSLQLFNDLLNPTKVCNHVDVTLACDDCHQIQAHKLHQAASVLLSSVHHAGKRG